MNVDEIWQPHKQQQIFRVLLEAMSRPGTVQSLPINSAVTAEKALLATLLDAEVSLCDKDALLEMTDWPLLQAKEDTPGQANYILCEGSKAPYFKPQMGSLSCPDESATVIIKVSSLKGSRVQLTLKGPGIENIKTIGIDGLNKHWLKVRQDWVSAFPLGVDFFIVDDSQVMGLPRTTTVEGF